MKKMILAAVLALFVSVAFCQSHSKRVDTTKNTPASPAAFTMHYDDLFKHNMDGSVSPLQLLQINGEMVNTGVKITSGSSFGGIDIWGASGHDVLVDTAKGMVIVRKFLK